MVTGYEGTQEAVDAKRTACTALLSGLGGTSLGEDAGWATGRFHGPYLRDSLLDVGVLVETLETVTFWSNLHRVYDAVSARSPPPSAKARWCSATSRTSTRPAPRSTSPSPRSSPTTRSPSGCAAKEAASDAIIDNGASITHHHAVGQDHKPWLAREIGPVGVRMLRALKAELDPTGVLNPGVLIPVGVEPNAHTTSWAVLLGDDLAAALVEHPRRVARAPGSARRAAPVRWRRTRAAAAPRAARVADRRRARPRSARRPAPRWVRRPARRRPPRRSTRRRTPRRQDVVRHETRLVRPHPRLQEPRRLGAVGDLGVHHPAARGETLHLTRADHGRPHRRGVPQRPAEHPGHDLEVGVRVVGVPGARRQQLVVVRDQAPEPDVARVVVRARTRTSATSSAPRPRCGTGPAPAGTRSPAHARILPDAMVPRSGRSLLKRRFDGPRTSNGRHTLARTYGRSGTALSVPRTQQPGLPGMPCSGVRMLRARCRRRAGAGAGSRRTARWPGRSAPGSCGAAVWVMLRKTPTGCGGRYDAPLGNRAGSRARTGTARSRRTAHAAPRSLPRPRRWRAGTGPAGRCARRAPAARPPDRQHQPWLSPRRSSSVTGLTLVARQHATP